VVKNKNYKMPKETKEITALVKTYDLLLWLIPQLEKFPKSQRYLLGDRIETRLLDVMDLLVRAAYTRNKTQFLRDANLTIEQLRYLVRLVKDLRYLSLKGYEFVSKNLNEIGAEIGGWLKFHLHHEKSGQPV
jgi:hypothetical protein